MFAIKFASIILWCSLSISHASLRGSGVELERRFNNKVAINCALPLRKIHGKPRRTLPAERKVNDHSPSSGERVADQTNSPQPLLYKFLSSLKGKVPT